MNNIEKFRDISKYIRNYGLYYIEFKILIHPLAILFTYFFQLIKISPNFVSSMNILFSIFCLYAFIHDEYLIALLTYWIRTILDYSDGALARYTSKTTRFGKYFDLCIDWSFYVSLWVLVALNHVNIWFIFFIPLTYILLVDFIIEPQIKNLKKRDFLKNYFMKKGIIIGFAPFGIFELWILFLHAFININDNVIFILTFLVLVDLIYRFSEIIIYTR
tara:strand:+ start:901 stop:1554 length:654 start_codon:yes stop_codon:yes gene_type:complete